MTVPEPTPTAEHIDAVARHLPYLVPWERLTEGSRNDYRRKARRIMDDPAVHAAMLDALVRAGVLAEEWAVQYECDLSTPMMSGETERTITTQVPSEDRARQAVKNHAPINARNRRMARRLATEWEVAP